MTGHDLDNPLPRMSDRELLEFENTITAELNEVSQRSPESDEHSMVFAAFMMCLYEIEDRGLRKPTIN